MEVSDAIITDGSQYYDNVWSYGCLWHKMKNFFNADFFPIQSKALQGEAPTMDPIITHASTLHLRRERING
jgi:microcystin degradation protein MlrC